MFGLYAPVNRPTKAVAVAFIVTVTVTVDRTKIKQYTISHIIDRKTILVMTHVS